MKASWFLRLFGWCGGYVVPKPDVLFCVGDEEFQLVFANNGAVKWRLAQRDIKESAPQPPTQQGTPETLDVKD